MLRFLSCLLLSLALVLPLSLQAQDLPPIEEKVGSFTKMEGFFPLYWDADAGKVWLEIPRMEEDFLYVNSMPAGLGSNDIGLDRGQLGGERVVRFERVGPKVLLVAPNLRYRADSDNEAERKAVRDAFAESVVWGFKAEAITGERVLVDATDFIVRDAHGVVRSLQNANQGTFRLETSRSTPYLEQTKVFPENTEMEARLTFIGERPGGYVRSVASDPYAVTVRVRHSFVKLPPPGYTPRVLDPRSGFFGFSYVDYATAIGEEKERRFIARHRLQKKDPSAAVSEAAEPIVYYLDPGTPEPVRSALLEGARWWADAFEAAGFKEAYRVEMLPEGADPMDVRYNVIQWVHRSTRGWSYGSSVTDPRTGEIIKGHVSLGSLRVRQDYLIAEGLLAPYDGVNRKGMAPEDDPMLKMALARIRQLSAHEVGHTLGLAHNFAASVENRASVMDYPAPLATLNGAGQIMLNEAYDTGIGEWDKVAIRYGYSELPAGGDEGALGAILDEAQAAGLVYITDTDARPPGAAHPIANLWDNGTDMIEALEEEMQVRRVALERFSEATVREGRPLATQEEVLVPLYLRHRYQVDATVKMVGGATYSYTLRGDGRPLPQPIAGERQRKALEALLATLAPSALALPPKVRIQIPPRPPAYGRHRELFEGYSGLMFDPYAPAEVAASMVLSLLVHPERATRLAYQDTFDESLPGLREVLSTITERVWESSIPREAYDAELQRLVQQVWTEVLLETVARPKMAPAARAQLLQHLRDVHGWLQENPGETRDHKTMAHRSHAFEQIDRYLFRTYEAEDRQHDLTTPPGSPIGQDGPDFLMRQAERRAYLQQWGETCTFQVPGS